MCRIGADGWSAQDQPWRAQPASPATGRAHRTLAEGTPPTLDETGRGATANSCGAVFRTRLLLIGSLLVAGAPSCLHGLFLPRTV